MNLVAEYYYYYSLSLLAFYPNSSSDEQTDYLKIIEVNQEKMKKWAEHAPENFLHKYLLVEAEKSTVSAPKRRAANEKLVRVRVESSKNRLTQVLPARREYFL